jgi:hypothetical protein
VGGLLPMFSISRCTGGPQRATPTSSERHAVLKAQAAHGQVRVSGARRSTMPSQQRAGADRRRLRAFCGAVSPPPGLRQHQAGPSRNVRNLHPPPTVRLAAPVRAVLATIFRPGAGPSIRSDSGGWAGPAGGASSSGGGPGSQGQQRWGWSVPGHGQPYLPDLSSKRGLGKTTGVIFSYPARGACWPNWDETSRSSLSIRSIHWSIQRGLFGI